VAEFVDCEEYLSLANETLSRLDELPDEAADFADGVREKLEGMVKFMEQRDVCTEKMAAAIENMASGVDRWLDHSY